MHPSVLIIFEDIDTPLLDYITTYNTNQSAPIDRTPEHERPALNKRDGTDSSQISNGQSDDARLLDHLSPS